MIIELEARRQKLEKLQAYLERRLIPVEALQYDPDAKSWVVGCFTVGRTLTEAEQIIPRHL